MESAAASVVSSTTGLTCSEEADNVRLRLYIARCTDNQKKPEMANSFDISACAPCRNYKASRDENEISKKREVKSCIPQSRHPRLPGTQ